MENTGAIGSTRHAGVRDPKDVTHSFFEEIFWDWEHPRFGNSRSADGPCILHDEDMIFGDAEGGIMNPFLNVGVVFKNDGGSFVMKILWRGSRGFYDGAIGSQVAA